MLTHEVKSALFEYTRILSANALLSVPAGSMTPQLALLNKARSDAERNGEWEGYLKAAIAAIENPQLLNMMEVDGVIVSPGPAASSIYTEIELSPDSNVRKFSRNFRFTLQSKRYGSVERDYHKIPPEETLASYMYLLQGKDCTVPYEKEGPLKEFYAAWGSAMERSAQVELAGLTLSNMKELSVGNLASFGFPIRKLVSKKPTAIKKALSGLPAFTNAVAVIQRETSNWLIDKMVPLTGEESEYYQIALSAGVVHDADRSIVRG